MIDDTKSSNLSESKPLVYPAVKMISSGGYSNAVEKAVDVVFYIDGYGGPSESSGLGGEWERWRGSFKGITDASKICEVLMS